MLRVIFCITCSQRSFWVLKCQNTSSMRVQAFLARVYILLGRMRLQSVLISQSPWYYYMTQLLLMVGYLQCLFKFYMMFFTYIYVGSDFMVPGGFNVTIRFGPDDDRQPFPLEILEDMIGEGKEVIKLLLTTSGDMVRSGGNHTTTITISDNGLSMLTPYKPKTLCDCCLVGI